MLVLRIVTFGAALVLAAANSNLEWESPDIQSPLELIRIVFIMNHLQSQEWPETENNDPELLEKIKKVYSKERAYKLPPIELKAPDEVDTNNHWSDDILYNLPPFIIHDHD